MDQRSMKFRDEEFYGSWETPGITMQDSESSRKFWIDRELQSQGFLTRKLSRSVKGGCKNMGVSHLERSRTGPRSGLLVDREEDSYSSQDMVSVPRFDYRTCNELQTEDELYPVMSTLMDYQRATTLNEGYAPNAFGSRKGVGSHPTAFEGSTMSYTPNYRNSQTHNFQQDGHFAGRSEYSVQSFVGGHSHPQSRFQDSLCDHPLGTAGSQEGDRILSRNSYLLQSSSSNNAYNFPVPMHQRMALPLVSEREMSIGRDVHRCTCCKEHPSSQGSSMPHPLIQYRQLGYQHSQTCFDYGNQKPLLSKSSRNSLRSLQVRRKVADPLSEAAQAKKENSPPVPGPYASPYVLCQGCDRIVQISTQPYFDRAVVKVRCSACRRVSKFCNILHPCYQKLFKERQAASSLEQAVCSDSFNKQELPSELATVSAFESNLTVQKPLCREPIKSELRNDDEDKQMEASRSPTKNDLSSFTSKGLHDQGVDETDGSCFIPLSRSGTSFNEDSSSLFSASGSISTKNTAVHKLQESQQTDTNGDFVTPSTFVKDPSSDMDSIFEQVKDNGQIFFSEGLQGLMLECLEKGCHDDLRMKTDDSDTSHRNQCYQQIPKFLSDNSNGELAISSAREQTHCLESISLFNSNKNLSHAAVAQTDKPGCHSPESEKNLAEVFDEGAKSTARGPEAGSPLYEHLSYDSGSETAETATTPKNPVQGKQTTTHAPLNRDTSKGSNFLSNFLKKNMQLATSGHGSNKNTNVVVNGRVIPHDVLKIAEKRAGTIRPGLYWYDYEAGFWGVNGGPCLGIIPPFIAEFKIPLAKDCAGGTTDILVNGRELHKKDLDVLASRGLPRTPGKSYMVDISGQVIDKSSGQMLRSLGRLAPTIQKRGRGCGMFQPPSHS